MLIEEIANIIKKTKINKKINLWKFYNNTNIPTCAYAYFLFCLLK